MKVGDKVRCINPDNSAGLLTKGDEYTIKLVAGSFVKLVETADHYDWLIDRFVIIPDYLAITRSVA